VVAAAGWAVAGWFLWGDVVPNGLDEPDLAVRDLFSAAELERASDYERFVRWDFVASQVVGIGVIAAYAVWGARLMRESAAGRIGTGMLLAMLGLAIIWLTQLPFGLAELWWQRRHGLSHLGYLEWIFETWFALGGEFLFVSLAILIVMGLAGLLRDWWWIPGGAVFVALAILFAFVTPYLLIGQRPLDDPRLADQARVYEERLGLPDIPVRVQDVGTETSAPNALAAGLGPTRRVVLWETIVRPPFSLDEQEVVLAHELGHHARNHIWKSIAWYALFAFPGAFVIARVTRRRGGMREPAAVPLSLFVLVALSFVALPAQNAITRHLEAEADWVALQLTRDPDGAASLFEEFTRAAYAEPDPPAWSYVLLENHPTTMQRIEMARAWEACESP
jgi:STE24 endopeptidase